MGLIFSSPFQDESLPKTLESRSVISRTAFLGSQSLELFVFKLVEFKS
jgi:hypothetical protein